LDWARLASGRSCGMKNVLNGWQRRLSSILTVAQ
jgi:hypothetical protein